MKNIFCNKYLTYFKILMLFNVTDYISISFQFSAVISAVVSNLSAGVRMFRIQVLQKILNYTYYNLTIKYIYHTRTLNKVFLLVKCPVRTQEPYREYTGRPNLRNPHDVSPARDLICYSGSVLLYGPQRNQLCNTVSKLRYHLCMKAESFSLSAGRI